MVYRHTATSFPVIADKSTGKMLATSPTANDQQRVNDQQRANDQQLQSYTYDKRYFLIMPSVAYYLLPVLVLHIIASQHKSSMVVLYSCSVTAPSTQTRTAVRRSPGYPADKKRHHHDGFTFRRLCCSAFATVHGHRHRYLCPQL